MNEFSGSFSGHARVITVLSLTDVPGHELQTVEIGGPQSSTDEKWKTARVTYWGGTDVVAGNGSQRGHFVNEHPDGSRNFPTSGARQNVAVAPDYVRPGCNGCRAARKREGK